MTAERFDREFWEARWARALREHPEAIAHRPPNAHLTAELAGLEPGRALDAGCGHGSEAIWLASRGWRVTAVDFSSTALEQARARAGVVGRDVAERIDWVEGDLSVWAPPQESFDLVTCLYVHAAGRIGEMVGRLGAGVAPGGTLFLVGFPQAPGQVQVTVGAALEVLQAPAWRVEVAEERPRAAGDGADAVIRAVRHTEDVA